MADIKIYGKLKNATESGKVADYSDIDGAPEIAQATGQSTEKTMSQKAITDAINAGGGGGGSGTTYSVVEVSTSATTLTTEQYNTLIASPFNKIHYDNRYYDLYQEDGAQLVYVSVHLNVSYKVTITKSTKAIAFSTTHCLTSISSYVKNSLDYNVSSTTFALSAYQGKVLNDRLTILENAGGGGGTGSDIPVLDLGEVSSMGSSINLTSDQVSWMNANYNKISAIKFSDTTDAGGTMPLLLSTGTYQERMFYYGGVYGSTIYYAFLDMDNYSGTATSGTYYIQKSNTDGAGGGSGSEPVEQETMFSGQYNTWYNGDSSEADFNLDTSTAGLTHAKIETLEFTFTTGTMGTTSSDETSLFQISLNDISAMIQSGTSTISVLGGKFNLDFSNGMSLSYDQGTFNYSISMRIAPNWNQITSKDYAQVSTGFTYRGFKFANGSTY